jgi:ABC-type polysaccharide/polyol phosphate transport system ATPase subunit
MSKIAIKVENLSKAYQLGAIGTGTISRDIERWWAVFRGKEDPFLKIGEINDKGAKSKSNVVWSLNDLNFEINQGEAVGIIGSNGAGKSTLLKILSRITAPTRGRVSGNGRVASLLEIGTGFHPELTGRENIYLNGTMLGMRKREIDLKFDEIVDFSGVEKYIDTPVKRYSSGMYVRLAFAVAAHLESEILIVDEVLAVGDAEFQKKCLGKMGEVSKGEGRTVLFVSHNLSAVQKLCNRGIFLEKGKLMSSGKMLDVIEDYQQQIKINTHTYTFPTDISKDQIAYFEQMQILDELGIEVNQIPIGKKWRVKIRFVVQHSTPQLIIGFGLISSQELPIRTTWSSPCNAENGIYEVIFEENQIVFAPGEYKIVLGLSIGRVSIQYLETDCYIKISDSFENIDDRVIDTRNGILLNQMHSSVIKVV